MKKLMILGAGVYQLPLIRAAKELGIYTIAVSIPGSYPGLMEADEGLHLNTVDRDAVLRAAQERQINGIATAGTDVAVRTLGHVADAMHLTGVSEKAAELACDKLLMKQAFEKNGVRTARYREVFFTEDVTEKIEGLEYPLIVKIVDSSGSRGITRVNTPEELPAAVAEAKRWTRSSYYLVEEFIVGNEFGAQAFVQDGKVEFILPHGDYVFEGSTGVPAGHYAPFEADGKALEGENLKDCLETAEKAVRALGLDDCAVNCDFIMRDGKTYVLELGARSGATCLAELVSIYYGYDYYEKIVRRALGEHIDFPKEQHTPNASHLLMSPETGVITGIVNRNSLADPDIVETVFDYRVGEHVRKFHLGPDRIGHVITKGKTLEEAQETLKRALGNIEIDVAAD